MFEYELTGKQVILVLADAVIDRLRPLGVAGSPLFGTVQSMERHGLWLDAPAFGLCPKDGSKLYDAKGNGFCHAHIFIPADAIVSAVAFPGGAGTVSEDPGLHHIGFAPPASTG